ncbi:ATP-binding cassette domain-containing protein [Desulfurispira natronophila]|uniref:ABC-type Fe3+/spermidine/putrescine transport system ATPase subunit n=1 Tax=Desulfurispira natronophila TaxID=682562 RepID=A0A7W7Y4M2_9BACT|nr:ATP-binding cassette domain-containing protein [Desulfurispira natronophila]MBB5021849.1 ABC-type Fe3+/spermidine/putrescine transport system ATPase subunit [Desulfurispira natronophila]
MLHLKQLVIDGASDTIDYTFKKGQLYSFLGSRESGREEIFNTLAGFTPPASGKVVAAGKDITNHHPSRRGMVTITAEPVFNLEQTVLENIMLYRSEDRKVALEAADVMGLGSYVHRRCRNLDLGILQRINMARALSRRPRILLLHDPVDRLGFAEGLHCIEVLKSALISLGTVILHFTACPRAALGFSDEVLVVEDGIVVEASTPENLYFRPHTRFSAEITGDVNYIKAVGTDQNHLQISHGYPLSMTGTAYRVTPGIPYLVMFRPEAATLVASASFSTPLTVPAQVRQCEFTGRGFRVTLRSELEEELFVFSFDPVLVDQWFMVHVPPTRLHLIGEGPT